MIKVLFLGLILAVTVVHAGAVPQATVHAEEIEYDDTTKITRARGDVRVEKDAHLLKSDEVIYDSTSKMYKAPHAFTYGGQGYSLSGRALSIEESLKEGSARDITLRSPNDAWLKATHIHFDSNKKVIEKGVYTACTPCLTQKCPMPFWQIEADLVTHEHGVIRYEKPTFKIKGKKFISLPRFSHADFSKKRMDGFLLPSGRLSRGGFDVGLPYYATFGPNRDMTVTPRVSTYGDVEMGMEYRHLERKGYLELGGSLSRFAVINDGHKTRRGSLEGFINSRGNYTFSDHVTADFVAKRSTRRGYPTHSELIFDDHYLSQMTLEGLWNQTYVSLGSSWYQGLRNHDSPQNSPLVLPEMMISHSLLGEGHPYGDLTFKGSSVFIHRDQGGAKTKRGTMELEWDKSALDRLGMVYRTTMQMRGDLYYHEKKHHRGRYAHRLYPLGAFEWRYPLVMTGSLSAVIEPKASVVLSSKHLNPERIYNEDSYGFILDEATLFAPNQSPGYDRVSEGGRLNYGCSLTSHKPQMGQFKLFLGQSYMMYGRPFTARTYATGIRKGFSNIIGSVVWDPKEDLSLGYLTHLNPRWGTLTHHVAHASWTAGWTQSVTEIVAMPRHEHSVDLKDILFLHQAFNQKLTSTWNALGGVRFDLKRGRFSTAECGLTYKNECFAVSLQASRSFAIDPKREKSWGFSFMLGLRTLGGYDEIKTFPSKP